MSSVPILPLINRVQHYDWGSRNAIAELLGEPPSDEPQAELWMGAHPRAPSQVCGAEGLVSLDVWIARNPESALGARLAAETDSLPFLFKVLSAARPLSIQAHPDANRARTGFEREERAGIPRDAPNRCYSDPHAKPELICALTSFTAMNRFRASDEIAAALGAFAPNEIARIDDPRELLATLLRLGPDPKRSLLERAREWAGNAGRDHEASGWLQKLCGAYPGDIGALAPLFLNLVELAPGEAMFLPPGELHAYLEGTALEVMANSDNVLRGGLTTKHVDPDELLSVLADRRGPAVRLRPEQRRVGEAVYPTPAREFELAVLETHATAPFRSQPDHGVEILLCTAGSCELQVPDSDPVPLPRGASAFVPSQAPPYRLAGEATVHRVAMPAENG